MSAPVTEHEGRIFDRVERWDARNADFPLQLLHDETVAEKPLVNKYWTLNVTLDQGNTEGCTGNGTTHMLLATPRPQKGLDEAWATDLYYENRFCDEWPGEDYDGSSVTGAMVATKKWGRINTFVWPRTAREVAVALGYNGPVVIGVDWTQRMMDTDPAGYVHATGKAVGGHCVCLIGYHLAGSKWHGSTLTEDAFELKNSWSADWGVSGNALLRPADLDRLLGSGGDAALATKVTKDPGYAHPKVGA
jgi:hypothetical protein